MYTLNTLYITELTTEHLHQPLGIDCVSPRFGWKLKGNGKNVKQLAYQLRICALDGEKELLICDTGEKETDQSIEVQVDDFEAKPMTTYRVYLKVWDNKERTAEYTGGFETGRMNIPFRSSWIEPCQEPTPSSFEEEREGDGVRVEEGGRDFHEFRPVQYIRIPVYAKKDMKRARIYATAHGLYRLEINGVRPDDREFAPENTAYHKLMYYQTYDITKFLKPGENIIGVMLGDGWWTGRVGTTGDCCQYGDTIGLLMDGRIEYMDGTVTDFSGEEGVSATGPILFSDLFVGEKYDAKQEIEGWSTVNFDDSGWQPVLKKDYKKDHLVGQFMAPVRPLQVFTPKSVITTPKGETVLDVGQIVAGHLAFTVTSEAGRNIVLEHSEVMDEKGNFYNNILNTNKEQTIWYRTKAGTQSYRPVFTYHGFHYVKITGWPGSISVDQFKVYTFASEMEDLGYFHTSDERINQLESNIWWSQVANTISIPTDCPQREKAGWTGDIMAFAPTLCFKRNADAFLTGWMANVRAEQMEHGEIPMIVPYLKAYATFLRDNLNADTSCGWGDAVLRVPLSVYEAYGDRRILEENYEAMKKWLSYIEDRAANHHPEEYDTYTDQQKEHDRYLWSTDFHFGDWLVPSMVLGNPDAMAMNNTAYATMRYVAPAYFAYSTLLMKKVAEILNRDSDAAYYSALYEKIKEAYIAEYVREDGTMEANLQGIYVITLKMGLVSDNIRPKMVEQLCRMIHENGDKLDTGFLSVLFLMDVLCDNGRSDVAYKLLYQTGCPGWLYEVLHNGTTMWESWGATGEDGTVSTYSYNHYAFGCIGEWMYRHIGGLNIVEPGYKRMRIEPHFDCGLDFAEVSEETPYGKVSVSWHMCNGQTAVHIVVPVNTTAEICLKDQIKEVTGSGTYDYIL